MGNRALVNEKSERCMGTDQHGVIGAGHTRAEEIITEYVFSMQENV